jgi:hypothetical protein
MLIVIVLGGVALVVIAVVAGRAEGMSQRDAWSKIARERRELGELRRLLDERADELWEWESQLAAAGDGARCPVCALRRQRGQRPED